MNYILMNEEMARVTSNYYKTQTRRAIMKIYDMSLPEPKKHPIAFKNAPKDLEFKNLQGFDTVCPLFYSKSKDNFYCGDNIKYQIGERIWVREPAFVTNYISRYDSTKIDYQLKSNNKKEYRIDLPTRFFPNPKKWITNCQSVPNGCIFEMAKTFLVITDVRVERLQDIRHDEIILEGFDVTYKDCCGLNDKERRYDWWVRLWNKTAPKGYKWEDNPFVIVYDFKREVYTNDIQR